MADPEWLARARAEGRVTEGPRATIPAPPADCPEAAFTRAVIDLARSHGWLAYHPLPARPASGRWVTAFLGDAGLPDLVLARDRLIFAELKTARGRLTRGQREWVWRLAVAGVAAYVWRPCDWEDIGRVLGAAPPAWWVSVAQRGEG